LARQVYPRNIVKPKSLYWYAFLFSMSESMPAARKPRATAETSHAAAASG
jgi:hypothetical protein